jgi:hypothetical protein
MRRRDFLKTASLAAVMPIMASCGTNTTGSVTIQSILDFVKASCGFVINDVNSVVGVIVSIVGTFNADLGAGAAVAVSLATNVENMICSAVTAFKAQAQAERRATPGMVTVVVNGVPVKGTLV